MARYLKHAIDDGSLREYVNETNEKYRRAAAITLEAIDQHLARRRLTPMGGLYTVVDVGTDADTLVPRALQTTGVLVVPGRGFGPSLVNGIRISYGPLVTTPDRIAEGIERLSRSLDS